MEVLGPFPPSRPANPSAQHDSSLTLTPRSDDQQGRHSCHRWRRGTGSRASCHRVGATFAASGASPPRSQPSMASGEAVPGDGAVPRRPPRNALASDARALFPIARAASRGLAQPGFNEVALRVPSSAAGATRPRRNLRIIENSARYYGCSRRPDHDAMASCASSHGSRRQPADRWARAEGKRGHCHRQRPGQGNQSWYRGLDEAVSDAAPPALVRARRETAPERAHTDFARVRNRRGPRQRRRGSRRRGAVAAEGLEHWPSRRSLHGPCERRARRASTNRAADRGSEPKPRCGH
jgi:hypothetical protein